MKCLKFYVKKYKSELFFLIIVLFFLVNCRSAFTNYFQPEILSSAYGSGGSPSAFHMDTGKSLNFTINNKIGYFLTDDQLYALAGWSYVHGKSPDSINFEHPPLAKYLIGVSELLFMNPSIVGILVSVLTLLIVYMISKEFIKQFPIALIPALLLSLDKLYLQFTMVSMLDIYVTFFAVLSIMLLLKKNNLATVLLYVALGLAISCKWIAIFFLVIPPLYYIFNKQSRNLQLYPIYLGITFLTYTLTYSAFFLAGHTIQDFITLQFQILSYHESRRLLSGNPPLFWNLLNFLTGIEGPTQAQTLLLNPENRTVTLLSTTHGLSLISTYNPLTWPISFSASLLLLFYSIKENRRSLPIPLGFLSVVAFTSVGKPFIWYMLPGLPFAFISLGHMINKIYSDSKNKNAVRTILEVYLLLAAVWSLYINLPLYIKI